MRLPVKAVLSDGGNILFSDEGVKRGPYDQIKHHIPDLSYEDFRDGFRAYKTRAQTEPGYDTKDALRDYLSELGHAEVFAAVQKSKGRSKRTLELIAGVKETLQSFYESGIPFIVLTDATKRGEELKPFLDRLDIGDYVTDIISSKDVGARKPHPRFFETALEKYSLEKEDVIFIAHDDDELAGASDLGIRVYAFNYEENQDLSYLPEECKLQDFRELIKIVLGDSNE